MRWFVLFLPLLVGTTHAARILGLFPTPARSHSRVFEVWMNELAARGHDVTFASAVPPQLQPPSTELGGSFSSILLKGLDLIESKMDFIIGPDRRPLSESIGLWITSTEMCEVQLASPELQPLFTNKSIKFDMVIVEVFYFDCMVPFARYFGAHLVAATSFWTPPWGHAMIANPDNPAISPNFFLPYGDEMNFVERMHNTIHTLLVMGLRRWLFIPRQDAIARKFFGEDMPSILELETETALFITNTHPAVNFPHENVPNMIEVGGIHIKPLKPLPKDLLKYLDDAREGVVIFSLGSMINNDNLPSERLQLLTSTMAALPYSVLWRWDTTNIPNLSPNVRVEKWMPQRDILAHSNVRLLVTHGGLLSALEATVEGVPRIIMPFFGDQHMNAWRAVQHGVALSIDFYSAKPEHLINATMQVLTNPSYRAAAKRLSETFRDQSESPLDRAVFWTEYVLRHKGATHLRSAAKHLAWYQLYLLDVVAVLLLALVPFIIAIRALLRLVCTKSSRSSLTQDLTKKTK